MARKWTAVMLALGLAACATMPGEVVREGDIVRGTGTVTFVDFEGGYLAIRGDDGRDYLPTVLASNLAHDGLRVRFTGRLRPDVAHYGMGEVVELLAIERIWLPD